MFVTFTKKFEHFTDNIYNGFLLNDHKVQFKPSTYELITSLMIFWDTYNIDGKTISYFRNLRNKHNGINNEFWNEYIEKSKTDSLFSSEVSLLLGQFHSAPIKMKCFTEIRDNQKINPHHTGYFGNYGILMKEEWLLRNGGCPVIYVNNSMSLTNILGRNFSIMQTLDHCLKSLAKIEGLPIHHGAFFDFMSFVESSEHRYEYEWRIVSGHKLGGASYLPQIDRVKFELSDIHSLYVPDENAKADTLSFLNTIESDNSKLPIVFLTNEIVLSEEEIQQIDKIKSRKN